MKKIIGIFILIFLISMLFIYCGNNDNNQNQDKSTDKTTTDKTTTDITTTDKTTTDDVNTDMTTTDDVNTDMTTTEKTNLKVAMSTDIGGVNDESFNASAWAGLQKANMELGIDVKVLESKSENDYDRNLKNLADENYDLIWGIGFLMADAITKSANDYPDHKFGIIDSDLNNNVPLNTVSIMFEEHEGSFLVGMIAGLMTQSNKIGFIGGERFPLIRKFMYGYMAGVLTVNKEAEIIDVWADSFVDASKGKTLANSLYGDGVDVIFHAAGNVGKGLFEAAKDNDKWAIGVDSDQRRLAPDHILTSMLKRVDNAIYDIALKLQAGEFPSGSVVRYGLKEGGVGYAPTHPSVTEEILEEVERYKNMIINGSLEVPFDEKSFEDFKANL